jgi:hypothetical protein
MLLNINGKFILVKIEAISFVVVSFLACSPCLSLDVGQGMKQI